MIGSDWLVHSLLSGSQHKGLSFLLPHNVGQRGELDERVDGRRDGGAEYWRDRGLWMYAGRKDGMLKRGMPLLESERGRLEK